MRSSLSIDLPVDLDDECGDDTDESSNVAFSRSYLKLIKLFGRIQNQIVRAFTHRYFPVFDFSET